AVREPGQHRLRMRRRLRRKDARPGRLRPAGARGRQRLDAAPLTCAGVTTYKALKVADVRPAQLVAISGVGGLGHLAVQYAKIAGATVATIDVTDDKLQLARELGADIVIDARTQDVGAELKRHGGAHAALALAVNPA